MTTQINGSPKIRNPLTRKSVCSVNKLLKRLNVTVTPLLIDQWVDASMVAWVAGRLKLRRLAGEPLCIGRRRVHVLQHFLR